MNDRAWFLPLLVTALMVSGQACSDDGDSPGDAGTDAAQDAGMDAGSDPGADPGSDPGADPGADLGADPGSDPGSDPGQGDTDQPPAECLPLPDPTGEVVGVDPTQAASLSGLLYDASPGTTFLLADGNYDISDQGYGLWARADGVTIRSASGNPESVTIDGDYSTDTLVTVSANNVTIAELTLTRPWNHPIHVKSEDRNITGTHIYRVRIIDPGQQAIKINENNGFYADYGRIECCHIELTDAGRPHIRDNCYTGGVDAHLSQGWEIRLNTIKGFWCDTGLSEHGIHMWNQCRDTLVERNLIIDCARGIGFGMNENARSRDWDDNPYPEVSGYIGHIDGIIRNNFIFANIPGHDSGILLEQARGSKVVHNTVVSWQEPYNSIEYRWPNTLVDIKNNLVAHDILRREDANANLEGNLENASMDLFENTSAGELHLAGTAAAAIDQGVSLEPGLCDRDIDGEIRDASPDLGADEWVD